MRKILYGTQHINELHINDCHHSLCERKQRKKCDKKEKCLYHLFDYEERNLAKVPLLKTYAFGDRTHEKIEKAVEKWRVKEYKKCRPIRFIIERAK